MLPTDAYFAAQFFKHTLADRLKSRPSTKSMCERIIQFDCGHMCRTTIRDVEQQPRHQCQEPTCLSGLTLGYERGLHEKPKFERRATLCRMCQEKGKDGDIYQNSVRQARVRRASAPPVEAKPTSMLARAGDGSTTTKVSASIGRSNSNPERPPPSHCLRRIRDAASSSLRNEYNRLEPCLEQRPEQPSEPRSKPRVEQRLEQRLENCIQPTRHDGFEARRPRKHRPRDIITHGLDLDSSASAYVPFHERSPISPTGYTGLIGHAESIPSSSSLSLGGLGRSTSVLKALQKGLERKASNESFVCASAREVEMGEK